MIVKCCVRCLLIYVFPILEFLNAPNDTIELFNDDERRDSTGGIIPNDVIESLRQLPPLPTASETSDGFDNNEDSLWSRSFLKAANFLADKLSQVEGEQELPDKSGVQFNPADNGNIGEDMREQRHRREAGRPLPRSSSVTRFASWAKNTLTSAATVVAGNVPTRDGNGNEGYRSHLPPTGNISRSRVSDIPRPPVRMHKSSSVSG